MKEFIEELKHNQNINIEKGLENRVNIDYVIERLEEIEKELLKNTILNNYSINILNEIDVYIDNEKCYDSVKNNDYGVLNYLDSLTEEDKKEIADKILSDDSFSENLNECLNYYIYHQKKWEQ